MICTYCGRNSHTAAGCPTRPRALMAFAAVLALGACNTPPPVPPSRLAAPHADLMAEPSALEPIPACEGEITCRTGYYRRTRIQYVDLARRHRGLQRYVRVVSGR